MESHPYRQAVADRDLSRLVGLLADDVIFHSPVIPDPGFEGRDSVSALFSIVFDAITNVEYTHEFGDERAHVLVANAQVLGKRIKATTVLELNPDGKIREIWVMARPLTGVVAIAEAIGSQLAERAKPGRGAAVRALSKPLAVLAAVTERTGARMIAALNRSSGSGDLPSATHDAA